MNTLKAPHTFQKAVRLLLLATLLLAAVGVRAENAQQPRRVLLIFEMSSAAKKNLPAMRGTLAKLFASNMDNQLYPSDDIAVWTVDDGLHSAPSLITSWEPEEAAMYADSLYDFLSKQKYTRHASLAPIQPSLNRIANKSERLTILIFCDSQARLAGTSFDGGINEIITNTAARVKSTPVPLILVLRSYQGDYIGSSVNQSAPLNFPKFPAPPKPVPPPVLAKPASPPSRQVEGPVVTPIPAMIIVGTNAGTNISILTNAPPPPAITTPPTNSAATNTTMVPPAPATPTVRLTEETSQPAPATPAAPLTAPQQTPSAPPVVVSKQPAPVVPAPPAAAQSNTVATVAASADSGLGYKLPLFLGLGALASALVIIIRLIGRARRARSSLITSSMFDDRQPPQK